MTVVDWDLQGWKSADSSEKNGMNLCLEKTLAGSFPNKVDLWFRCEVFKLKTSDKKTHFTKGKLSIVALMEEVQLVVVEEKTFIIENDTWSMFFGYNLMVEAHIKKQKWGIWIIFSTKSKWTFQIGVRFTNWIYNFRIVKNYQKFHFFPICLEN